MSFINLMDNVVFTDADITARTESMVANAIPPTDERILVRKVLALILSNAGQLDDVDPSILSVMLADTQDHMRAFIGALIPAAMAGAEARADMARKLAVMSYESALKTVAMPAYDGSFVLVDEDGVEHDHPDKLKYDQVMEDANVIINAASEDTLTLYALRNPVVDVEIIPEEVPEVIPEEVPEVIPEETPEVILEIIPEEVPEIIPEEAP
jgi:hypothetical protein